MIQVSARDFVVLEICREIAEARPRAAVEVRVLSSVDGYQLLCPMCGPAVPLVTSEEVRFLAQRDLVALLRRVGWVRWRDEHGALAHIRASGAWWWDRTVKRVFEAPMVDLVQRSDVILRRRAL